MSLAAGTHAHASSQESVDAQHSRRLLLLQATVDLSPAQQATIVRVMNVVRAKTRKLGQERAQLLHLLQVRIVLSLIELISHLLLAARHSCPATAAAQRCHRRKPSYGTAARCDQGSALIAEGVCMQGLASYDAREGDICSLTLPEAGAFIRRLQEVQDEMCLCIPFTYSATIDTGWSTFVRPLLTSVPSSEHMQQLYWLAASRI